MKVIFHSDGTVTLLDLAVEKLNLLRCALNDYAVRNHNDSAAKQLDNQFESAVQSEVRKAG